MLEVLVQCNVDFENKKSASQQHNTIESFMEEFFFSQLSRVASGILRIDTDEELANDGLLEFANIVDNLSFNIKVQYELIREDNANKKNYDVNFSFYYPDVTDRIPSVEEFVKVNIFENSIKELNFEKSQCKDNLSLEMKQGIDICNYAIILLEAAQKNTTIVVNAVENKKSYKIR